VTTRRMMQINRQTRILLRLGLGEKVREIAEAEKVSKVYVRQLRRKHCEQVHVVRTRDCG